MRVLAVDQMMEERNKLLGMLRKLKLLLPIPGAANLPIVVRLVCQLPIRGQKEVKAHHILQIVPKGLDLEPESVLLVDVWHFPKNEPKQKIRQKKGIFGSYAEFKGLSSTISSSISSTFLSWTPALTSECSFCLDAELL